jgi:hypothetical protein
MALSPVEQQDDLHALEAERQRLALAVAEGHAEARTLDELEARIATLTRDGERDRLAERERQARAEREHRAQQEAQRRALEERVAALWPERLPLAAEIEDAADHLVAACGRLLALGQELSALDQQLHGRVRARRGMREAIRAYVQWRVSEHFSEFGRPEKFWRRPLREILGAQTREGAERLEEGGRVNDQSVSPEGPW